MSKRVSRTSLSSAAAADFVLKRSGDLSRTGLLLGTALGCSIAVFSLAAPGAAWATGTCTPATSFFGADQSICGPGDYPSGITFTDGNTVGSVVVLQPGADPGSDSALTNGVFVENTSTGYGAAFIYAGSTTTVSGVGVGVYTAGGGAAIIRNYGYVSGQVRGLYGDAINGGDIRIYNYGVVIGGKAIEAVTSSGNTSIRSDGIYEVGGGDVTVISAVADFGTNNTIVYGAIGLSGTGGYATGVSTASTFNNNTQIDGSVYVQGATGALGVKTSSAYNAYTTVYGEVTVKATNGTATGVITVGSNYANGFVSGDITVTAYNGVATGIQSSSFNGSYISVGGGVSASGTLGATAVYDRTIYDRNASVTVDGNVYAISSGGSAVGILAEAGNATGDAFTSVDVTVGGDVTASGYTSATAIYTENLGGTVNIDVDGTVFASAVGDAVGIKSYAWGISGGPSSTITVGGDVEAFSILGNATAINASAFGNLYTTVYGSVGALSYAGEAVGVVQDVTHAGSYINNLHIYGDVSATGYAGAAGVELFGKSGAYSFGNIVIGGNVSVKAITGSAYGVINEGETASTAVGGNVYAYSRDGEALGVLTDSVVGSQTTIGGNVTALSYNGYAVGVESVAGSLYTNAVTVDGSVYARGSTGAVGIAAEGGEVDVHVDGDVSAYAISGNATGVLAVGDDSVYVGGNASAFSFGGVATAIYGNASGNMYVHVGQNVSAESIYNSAYGIKIVAQDSYVGIYVGGNVTAEAGFGDATGVKSYSFENTTLHIGGNVYAKSVFADATGLNISAFDNIAINVDGNVEARSYGGDAVGIFSYVTQDTFNDYTNRVTVGGDVTALGSTGAIGVEMTTTTGYSNDVVNVGGNVVATTTSGDAFGVEITNAQSANVTIGGMAYASSLDGNATAVSAGAEYDVVVGVGGDVRAVGDAYAFGVVATSQYGNVSVTVGENAAAYASMTTGVAFAIDAGSVDGYANVTVKGDVFASGNTAIGLSAGGDTGVDIHVYGSMDIQSNHGEAVGVAAGSPGDVTIAIDGSAYVDSGYGEAIGVYASSDSTITTTVGGNLNATASNGQAIGIEHETIAPGSTSNITVDGNVTVEGYYGAVGIAAVAYYNNVNIGQNLTVQSGQNDAIGVSLDSLDGNVTIGGNARATSNYGGVAVVDVSASIYGNVSVGGNVYAASGHGDASGILVKAGVVNVTVGGDVTALGYTGAVGVGAYGGSVDVHVTGSVLAESVSGDAFGVKTTGDDYVYIGGNASAVSNSGNATAVYGNSTGYQGIHVGGNVSAHSVSSAAVGINSYAEGDGVTFVGGNVTAYSKSGSAIGVLAAAAGNTSVTVGGDVIAEGSTGAFAVEADGNTVYVDIGGSVGAYSSSGEVIGVFAVSTNYNRVIVDGDVTASGNSGAIGLEAVGGYVNASVYGNVSALASNGAATGALVIGDSELYIGGNVSAVALAGNAIAADMSSAGLGYVTVEGNVYAGATGYATGVTNKALGYSSTIVGGDVYAKAVTGTATGVYAYSETNTAYVHVGGDAKAHSYLGDATAVYGKAAETDLEVVGNVTAVAYGNATGVLSVGTIDSYVNVGGNVAAVALNGQAYGVDASSSDSTEVIVYGSVSASSKFGSAIGVVATSGHVAGVSVYGNAVAYSEYGNAIAVKDAAGYQAGVHVGGTAYAKSKLENATGEFVTGGNYAQIYGGNVGAVALDGVAEGIYITSGDATRINLSGNVIAKGDTSATGVYAESKSGLVSVDIGGMVYARAYGNTIGVETKSGTATTITVGGDVEAISVDGVAEGVNATTSTANITVTVGGNVIAAGQDGAYGVIAETGVLAGTTSVTVDGGVSAATTHANAIGVLAEGGYANVTIGGNVSAYSVTGAAVGIEDVGGFGANVTVGGNVYSHSVSGAGAIGVIAESDGDVSITIDGDAEVKGAVAYGVFGASIAGGNVSINVGNVVVHQYAATTPYQGAGILSYTTGVTQITADNVYTTGNFTDGVRAGKVGSDNGDTYVTLNSVETTGAYSVGVFVYGSGNATANTNTVYTKGYKSDGLYAVSTAGGVTITSGTVKTLGDYSAGIYAMAGGPVVVTSGTSVTYGDHAPAVEAINSGVTPTDTVAVYSGNAV
ncbi:MAG TPA: hypothetical protein VG407_18655, partial [Caulobacteraceae bacterium]|nr:hypothetical protein [Caulobacteraceae bacterium]